LLITISILIPSRGKSPDSPRLPQRLKKNPGGCEESYGPEKNNQSAIKQIPTSEIREKKAARLVVAGAKGHPQDKIDHH